MPLPFILAGAAITAAGFGVKKGYDGYQDKSEASNILDNAKSEYDDAKANFDEVNDKTAASLTELGELQLKIGSDFKEFRSLSNDLLAQLNQSGEKDLTLDIPQHQLQKIDKLVLSTTAYLSQVAGGGVAGAAAAYAVYGGVMALAAASTGTPIAALSGAAAYNAAMAAIGGGSLAAGGLGMAGGAMVLGSVVAAPIVAIAGWAFASHAEAALSDAQKVQCEVDDAVSKMSKAQSQLIQTGEYVDSIYFETDRIYGEFSRYFDELKRVNLFVETGGHIATLKEELVEIIMNGYKVAAILTDIITTPLFKPELDEQGNVVINEDDSVKFETDADGMQVLNRTALDEALAKAN